jgi:hypothetical protein
LPSEVAAFRRLHFIRDFALFGILKAWMDTVHEGNANAVLLLLLLLLLQGHAIRHLSKLLSKSKKI